MAKLGSILGGRPGRPGDMLAGKPPRPPKPPVPPKPVKPQTATVKKHEPSADDRDPHDQDDRLN